VRTVYLTYDGLDDPLGQSQVLPHLLGLARRGHRFHVISFEKRPTRVRVAEEIVPGVVWTALRYHKQPALPATLFDITQGFAAATVLRALRRAELIHVRSTIPGAMALPLVRATKARLLFDTRSLWADEKVDAGAWPKGGALYRTVKHVERVLYRSSTAIIVLTHAFQRYLRTQYPHRDEIHCAIHVVPTCTDLDAFGPQVEPDAEVARQVAGASVLAYVGSFGTWYMAREMAELYLAWRKLFRSARFLAVSRQEPTAVREVLAAAGAASELVHVSADHERVPALLRCARAALCFVRDGFSKQASSPTKLGEALACGLPVAANVVGDMATVLHATPAGVVVSEYDAGALAVAAAKLKTATERPAIAAEARALAERWFPLDHALDAYDRVYRGLDTGDTVWPRE
jgi:glycosyltransferase involved in cell wall biosynthesis